MLTKIKNGIHIVAIDDSPHERGQTTAELFFTYCKGVYLEKVSHAPITIDGRDATSVILEELKSNISEFTLILLHGVTMGGLNIVDIRYICETLHKPLIAVTENSPTENSIFTAIEQLEYPEMRINLVKKAGTMYSYITDQGSKPVFFHICGISKEVAIEFFTKFSIRSRLPEQLLITHKIASAWK